jgi:hypothetical protein
LHAGTPDGVLHGYGSFFTFTNCTFTGNQGRQTGVMEIDGGDATFDGCTFLNNVGLQVLFFNRHPVIHTTAWIAFWLIFAVHCSFSHLSALAGARHRAC